MTLLALETAAGPPSLALLDGKGRTLFAEQGDAETRAEELTAMLRRLQRAAPGPWAEVSGIAATRGPGPFAGLRVGVAMARALRLALDVPLYLMPTTEALVRAMRGEEAGLVFAAVTGRSGSITGQWFRRGGNGPAADGDAGRYSLDHIRERLATGAVLAGAPLVRAYLEKAGFAYQPVPLDAGRLGRIILSLAGAERKRLTRTRAPLYAGPVNARPATGGFHPQGG